MKGQASVGRSAAVPRAGLWPNLAALTTPAGGLDGAGDRRRAELLAGLLLTLVGLGLLSGFVQLLVVPEFLRTFCAMLVALAALTGAYTLSRTRNYRVAAVITCLAPALACFAIAVGNPADRVAFPFMALAVVFATIFLSTRAACLAAGGVLILIAAASTLVPDLRSPERWIPAIAFHTILSAILLVAANHRNRIESDQDRKLLDAEARLRAAEDRTRQLERWLSTEHGFATVGRLSSGLGHDLNNLLLMLVNAHVGVEAKDERVATAIREAAAAGEMATELVNQMLALARSGGDTSERKLVDLNEVVRQASALLPCAAGRRCQIQFRYEDRCLPVSVYPLDLQRVLLNLATNAGKAMPDGGSLSIEVLGPGRFDRPERLALPRDRCAAVIVNDTGTGMDGDTLARSFEPFVTTHSADGGQGLGLAIVAELVRRQGGALDVSSAPGRGTRFTVLLPLPSS